MFCLSQLHWHFTFKKWWCTKLGSSRLVLSGTRILNGSVRGISKTVSKNRYNNLNVSNEILMIIYMYIYWNSFSYDSTKRTTSGFDIFILYIWFLPSRSSAYVLVRLLFYFSYYWSHRIVLIRGLRMYILVFANAKSSNLQTMFFCYCTTKGFLLNLRIWTLLG